MRQIDNPDNLPMEYIEGEIAQVEKEHNRTIDKIKFIDNGDGTCKQIIVWNPPVKFDRIRRITGYLVGTLDRFNNAKRSEVMDRVKHVDLNDKE